LQIEACIFIVGPVQTETVRFVIIAGARKTTSHPGNDPQAALAALLGRWEFWKRQTVAPEYPDSDPASYPYPNRFKGIYNGSWAPWIPPTGE
jgi:hypothetical protein